jgi:hypothetical protein
VDIAASGGAIVFTTQTPPLDIVEWTLRIMSEGTDGAGRTKRELTGEGAVPAEIAWDGLDVDGKSALSGETLFARLIVKTGSGDVGISPDLVVRLTGARAAAAATTSKKDPLALVPLSVQPASGAGGTHTIADPSDASGSLKPATGRELARIAKNAGNADVKIEVHTDDQGARLERRTRTQRAADEMKDALVKAGVPAERITAIGMGSDSPLAPNMNKKSRKKNRRADITITPRSTEVAPGLVPGESAPSVAPSSLVLVPPSVDTQARAMRANGAALDEKDGALTGKAPAMQSGEIVLDLRDTTGARASLHVRPAGGDVVMGPPPQEIVDAYAASTTPHEEIAAAPLEPAVDAGP